MVVSALLLAGTVYLFTIIPMGFIPSVDTGQFSGQIEAIQGLGFDATVAQHQGRDGRPPRTTRTSPATRRTSSGRGGRLNVDLKPRDERALDRRPGDRGAAAEAGAHPGHPGLPDEPAGDPHRRA